MPDRPILLAPVTPASYLAGRAALGMDGPEDDVDLDAVDADALVTFIDHVGEFDRVPHYDTPERLREIAGAYYAAWHHALRLHLDRAASRVDATCERLNWYPPDHDAEVSMPEEMLANPEWDRIRSLPLWEGIAGGQIAAALRVRDEEWARLRKTVEGHA